MSEIMVAVVEGGWPAIGYALIIFAILLAIFGFLPGVVNRLFAMSFPKTDPRRAEMIAELYAVERWKQPWWVLQQGERALFEGIPARRAFRESLRELRESATPVTSRWQRDEYTASVVYRFDKTPGLTRSDYLVMARNQLGRTTRSIGLPTEWLSHQLVQVRPYASGELIVVMFVVGESRRTVRKLVRNGGYHYLKSERYEPALNLPVVDRPVGSRYKRMGAESDFKNPPRPESLTCLARLEGQPRGRTSYRGRAGTS
jgi:hypothetical protein